MDRRTLLGFVLASPLGWFLPNSVKAAMLPGSQYRHFGEVLDEAADYASESDNSEVLSISDPMRRLWGFNVSYVKDGVGYHKEWMFKSLAPSKLQALVAAMPDPLKRILVERALCTAAGRDALARAIKKESQRLRGLGPVTRAISRPAAKKRIAEDLKAWSRT